MKRPSVAGGQMRLLFAAGVALLLLQSADIVVEGHNSTCAKWKSCNACIGHPACGWCASRQTCVPGMTSGPASVATCPSYSTFGVWNYGSCPNCADYDDCSNCVGDGESCGWCDSASTCVEGNSTTPFGLCGSKYFGTKSTSCTRTPSRPLNKLQRDRPISTSTQDAQRRKKQKKDQPHHDGKKKKWNPL